MGSAPAQILSGVIAGVAALSAAPALADNTAGAVDLFDDRKAKGKGFEIIYEARDLDLTQNEREGFTQYRGDSKLTRERYQEAKKRIKKDVKEYIEKQYWHARLDALVPPPLACPQDSAPAGRARSQ